MVTPLIKAISENADDLYTTVKDLLDAGADPNEQSKNYYSPLLTAAIDGPFDVIQLLLERGADDKQLGWTSLFHAVAYGSIDILKNAISESTNLEARDFLNRTPLLFSIVVGDIQKTKTLIEAGADVGAVGRAGKVPLTYAIEQDNTAMLHFLIELGLDIEQTNEFGDTPLFEAAENGAINCLKLLIDYGADINKPNHIPYTPIRNAKNLDIVHALLEAGADINEMDSDLRAEMLGLTTEEEPDCSAEDYFKGKHRVFGTSNPELSQNAFWYAMVRCGASAYGAIKKFQKERTFEDEAVWSYMRFGKSITPLSDGRFIEIAGEHEDFYDSDFCIYNDVFVHDGKGDFKIYTYPKEVFPTTDFHTATLVGDKIYIIGNLGYMGERQPNFTPVYQLDIHSLEIQKIETHGDMPSWISRHKAYFDGQTTITLKGGKCIILENGKEDYIDNTQDFSLCLKTLEWKKV